MNQEVKVIPVQEVKDISELGTAYNNRIIIPEVFSWPQWFKDTQSKFEEEVKKSFQKEGKINSKDIRFFLEKYILDANTYNIKPKYPLNSKNVKDLISQMYEAYPDEVFLWRYALLYEAAFFLSIFKPGSFQPEALILPKEFQIKKKAIEAKYHEMLGDGKDTKKKDKAIVWVNKAMDSLAKEVIDYFRKNDIKIADFVDSGAKGSVGDIRKLLLAVGLSITANGQINDVILNSHTEGLTPTQFFNYSSQGIVSQYSKSHSTAIPGYIVRKVYTALESVTLSAQKDCGTRRKFKFYIPNQDVLDHLKWRSYTTSENDNNLKEIDPEDKDLLKTTIYLRSPLYCQAKDGICPTCFGKKFANILELHPGENLGMKVVSSFSESLVNSALKAAHKGLDLDLEVVDLKSDTYKYSS